MQMKIPYSKGKMEIHVPEENFHAVLEAHPEGKEQQGTQAEIVERALDHVIGSPKLEELVKGKKRMVIITSDHTRPVPSRLTMPILLRRIRAGNPTIDVTILIATGFHRATTHEELVERFGEEIVRNERIVIHDSQDDAAMADLGLLPSGGRLLINRTAIDTDLLIAEGFIEPHFFAGFSGGRKSILPGIASGKTVMANHCSKFIKSDKARTGNLDGNPVHRDMLHAAQEAKLAFVLNVVINAEKEVIAAFAGDSREAHVTGCEYVRTLAEIRRNPSDIVVVANGGYPLDQNIYQAVKGMTAAEANCNEGGVIIMVAACNDGHGGASFYQMLKDAPTPRALLDQIEATPQEDTLPDQWEAQILVRILDRFTVIMVTDLCDAQMIRDMHMEHALTFDEALRRAFEIKGSDAKVTVIPDGVSVIVH
jgi:putative transcriptional regulator